MLKEIGYDDILTAGQLYEDRQVPAHLFPVRNHQPILDDNPALPV
jgi:hypothetical protein